MADSSKVEKFVELVLRLSLEGRLDWTETPEAGTFSAVLPEGEKILKVFSYSEFTGDDLPSLSIYSSLNKLVVDVQTGSVKPELAEKIERILTLARSRATGEDQTLDEVLVALQKLENNL